MVETKARIVKVKHFLRLLDYYLGRPDLSKEDTLDALRAMFSLLPEEKVMFAWSELKRTRSEPCCPQFPYLCDANCQAESDQYPFGEEAPSSR